MTGSKLPLKICIGAATRNRPKMLTDLLNSIAELEPDSRYETVVVIVENNGSKTLDSVMSSFKQKSPGTQVVYEHEPKIGIAYARNRVLDIAAHEDCDAIAFIDDDETADHQWLKLLVDEMLERNLDLVGGPVRLNPVQSDASTIQRTIFRGIVKWNDQVERSAAKMRASGNDERVIIVTNNWLCDNRFIRRYSIRFDEGLGLSGGEDSAFFRDAKQHGRRTTLHRGEE